MLDHQGGMNTVQDASKAPMPSQPAVAGDPTHGQTADHHRESPVDRFTRPVVAD